MDILTDDTYLTLDSVGEGIFTEKRSKFLAFAHHVTNIEQIKEHLAYYQKQYYDARHVCYAYMLGVERTNFRANDNGEPSGTAGKPILGQINSYGLTDILIVVIRYFGGIKLGTSGLIQAYKQASIEAIEAAEIVERTVDVKFEFTFDYVVMNDVMRIVKEENPVVEEQRFDNACYMCLRIRKSCSKKLINRLEKVDTLQIRE